VRRFVDLRGLCGRLIADSGGAVTSAEARGYRWGESEMCEEDESELSVYY
jgi:hypothetical protein